MDWAASAAVVEHTLEPRRGVLEVEASAVSQTATVTYDPDRTNVAEMSGWDRDCGYHCSGATVPDHVCDPMAEPAATATSEAQAGTTPTRDTRPPRGMTSTRRRPGHRRTSWATAGATVACQ